MSTTKQSLLSDMVDKLVCMKRIRDEYVVLGFVVPSYMSADIESYECVVRSKYKDDLKIQRYNLKKQVDALKSQEKQREEAEIELAKLDELLGDEK